MEMTESKSKTLTYSCPHCHEVMEVSSELADETIRCKRCERPFRAVAPNSQPLDRRSAAQERKHHHLAEDVVKRPADAERTLYHLHPSMLRNHPLIFSGVILMLLMGLIGMANYGLLKAGLDLGNWTLTDWQLIQSHTLLWIGASLTVISGLYLIGWRIQTWFETLKVTTERIIYQRGLISRRMSEVRHDDVRNLLVNQSFFQRFLDVGTVAVSSSGQDDFEITVKGMPHPGQIANTIRYYQ